MLQMTVCRWLSVSLMMLVRICHEKQDACLYKALQDFIFESIGNNVEFAQCSQNFQTLVIRLAAICRHGSHYSMVPCY